MTDDTAGAPSPIRIAHPHEYSAIGAAGVEAYRRDYAITDDYAHEIADVAGRAEDFVIWGAFAAGRDGRDEVAGTVSVLIPGHDRRDRVLPGEEYFRLLAVAPAYRRQGVGRALVRHVIGLAETNRARAVSLNSGEDMVGAHALYRSLGFHRDPHRTIRKPRADGREVEVYTFVLPLR